MVIWAWELWVAMWDVVTCPRHRAQEMKMVYQMGDLAGSQCSVAVCCYAISCD